MARWSGGIQIGVDRQGEQAACACCLSDRVVVVVVVGERGAFEAWL